MKLALFAAVAMVFSTFAVQQQADACGMYRPPRLESPSRLIAKAKRHEKNHELHAAAGVYSRLMYHPKARKTQKVWAGMRAAKTYQSVGNASSAVASYEAVVNVDRRHGPALLALGLAKLDTDVLGAVDQLDEALHARRMRHADKRAAHVGLAMAHARDGNLAIANRHQRRARRLGASKQALAAIQQQVEAYLAEEALDEAADAEVTQAMLRPATTQFARPAMARQ